MKTSVTGKRKTIQEFFSPNMKHKVQRTSITRGTLEDEATDGFSGRNTAVSGLSIYDNFVSHTEEQNILDFLSDSTKCTWRTDLSRRTMHFGGTFCQMTPKSPRQKPPKPQVLQAPTMPEDFAWLLQRMVDVGIYPEKQRPQYCIINEYTGNLGISAHTENFQFGEPVVGLSLLSACPIRFHELTEPFDGSVRSGKAGSASKTGRSVDVTMPSRSLLVMGGESRWKWQHEIVRSAKGRGVGWRRVSLTFRYKPEKGK